MRQPWAWAIFHGKDVENRSGWRYPYTGPLVVHAGQQLAPPEAFDDVADLADFPVPMLGAPLSPVEASLGAAIGVVELRAAHWWRDCRLASGRMCSPWAQRDAWHLVLGAPRVFEAPVPAPGRLGLWRPPNDVAAAALKVVA